MLDFIQGVQKFNARCNLQTGMNEKSAAATFSTEVTKSWIATVYRQAQPHRKRLLVTGSIETGHMCYMPWGNTILDSVHKPGPCQNFLCQGCRGTVVATHHQQAISCM